MSINRTEKLSNRTQSFVLLFNHSDETMPANVISYANIIKFIIRFDKTIKQNYSSNMTNFKIVYKNLNQNTQSQT